MALTNMWSNVYIRANTIGSTSYYMDINPHPRPVLRKERGQDVIEWTCSFIEDATAASIWTLYATFNDVLVNINDGAGEYLCRWAGGEAFQRITSGKSSYTVTFKFEVLNTRTSQVIISDYAGTNPVTLDFNPFPFPEPVQMKDGLQRIVIDSAYITRTNADLLRAKYPLDVRIQLATGGTVYICRFESLEIVPSTSNNLRLKAELTAVQYVGQTAAGAIKIADDDGANIITVLRNPYPFPTIVQRKNVSTAKTCPGVTGSAAVSGQSIHFDGGVHISDGEIAFSLPFELPSAVTSLETKYRAYENVRVSIDSGVTYYLCVFSDFERMRFGNPTEGIRCGFKIIQTV